IGGLFFGMYADRAGRKAALVLSVIMMCVGSLIIAVTPTYDAIGNLAPAVLLLARMLQGLSVGGEYGTSATYLSEIAPRNQRGFYSSFQYVTLVMGQVLALAVLIILQQFALTSQQLERFGWRIPFFIGALCALYALYLRRAMFETESFASQRSTVQARGSIDELLRHWRAALVVIGLTMGGTVAFYTYTTYMQKFLVLSTGLSKEMATLINAGTLFVFMLIQPLFGALSDRIGRRPLLLAFGILGTLSTIPILHTLADAKSTALAIGLIMLALTIVSGYTSINAVVKAELFPVHIRALGVGLAFSIAVSLFGGTAELIALWFKDRNMESGFYWYVTACIVCSLAVYATMKDTKTHSLIDRD
ncbi:MAG TPA: MFS transporter, partial [Steroidobacteraceae bacterium]|nr:MFS transporter [Steroidobacteraceae bacterium]